MKKTASKGQMNESSKKIMPSKYMVRFKARILNASHFDTGNVEKEVKSFYKMYAGKIDNPDFTLNNLMELADKILGGNGSDHIWGAGFRPGQNGGDWWWGPNRGKFMEENVMPISESDIRAMVTECVKKLMKDYGYDI